MTAGIGGGSGVRSDVLFAFKFLLVVVQATSTNWANPRESRLVAPVSFRDLILQAECSHALCTNKVLENALTITCGIKLHELIRDSRPLAINRV